jgi:hypothetical protein
MNPKKIVSTTTTTTITLVSKFLLNTLSSFPSNSRISSILCGKLNLIKGMSINCMSMCVKIEIWKKKKRKRRRTTTSILHLKNNYLNFNRLTFGVSNKIK